MNLSIIIPCYNEIDNIENLKLELVPVAEGLIGETLPDAQKVTAVEVIFVDDGSADQTFAALEKAFIAKKNSVITYSFARHDVNQGLGSALRTGFKIAKGDIIVTTDSDGTYRFVTIPNLLACLERGVHIVTASPYHPDGEVVGVPAYRIVLSRGSSLIYRLLVDLQIHTYTALFRAYRRNVIESIHFKADDYLGATELMVKALLKGYKVAEYPAALHRRAFGASKARLFRTIISHLRFQKAVLLHKLRVSPLV
ncbi:MAG: glycosyltransferase family 2 protein [Anaerolineales bacterium]|nr:glycosyltransferase family 2 protein [Anaerolineales bacterium]